MQHLYVTLRVTALLAFSLFASIISTEAHAQLVGDVNNGRLLYITRLVPTSPFSCSSGQCHGPTPENNQNGIQIAAGEPGLIGLAISQVNQMAFLQSNVTGQQLADLAAYIANPTAVGSPVAAISPTQFTFATTTTGATSASQAFTLSNSGTAPLVVSGVATSSAEFPVQSACTTVAVGSNCTINVSFAPTATGARNATLTVTHNAEGGSTTAALTGTGSMPASPVAQASPATLPFPATVVGNTSALQQITISNSGTAPLNITAIASNRADFQLAGGTCVAGGTVTMNASCIIALRFAPATVGSKTGVITISHNGAGGSTAVTVTGTGVNAQFEKRTMTEYIYTPLNYYFITSRDADKALLDTVAGFQRTGQSFAVYAGQETGTQGISRFYFDKVAQAGARGSHFYTLVESEKALLVQLNPGNVSAPKLPFDEGIDSYAFLPVVEGVGGSCAADQIAVYRIFRGGTRFPDDPNHRFTTSTAIYNEFVALGWDGEGVKFCVPTP